MKYGKRSLFKRILRSPITIFVLFLIFGFLTKTTWGMYQKALASKQRMLQSQAAYDELQKRQNDLQEKVAYLSTKDGIESEIRTKFRAAENGESVAVIVGDDITASAANASSTKELSFWQKILGLFGL